MGQFPAGNELKRRHSASAWVLHDAFFMLSLKSSGRSVAEFLRQVLSGFSENRCSTLAAALAYYTAFALPPLLYLMMALLTFGLSLGYDGDQAQSRAERLLRNQTTQLIGNQAATEQVTAILENHQQSDGKWWKAIVSFLGILFGATGVVAALQDSLNQVWGVKPDPQRSGIRELIAKRVLSFAMILGLGFLLLVSLLVSSVLMAIGDEIGQWTGMTSTIAMATNFAVQAVVVYFIFLAIYKFMPDVVTRWRDVALGAGVTTILFLIGRYAMQFYFSLSDPGAPLGSATASLAVLLVWVYYTAIIVLLGAQAMQVYAVRHGDGVQPDSSAVRVVEQIQRDDEASVTT
jgi:membrane protein